MTDRLDGWISVKDRLPEVSESRVGILESHCVLIVVSEDANMPTPFKPYVTVAHLMQLQGMRRENVWQACDCHASGCDIEIDEWLPEQVSHWMPPPKPPEEI